MPLGNISTTLRQRLADVVQQYWGFDSLRPIQEQAIHAALQGRDSLVVMPTGGGKSLCYQVPPLLTGRLTVVVSPLIALMKDQVDGLQLAGIAAAALHSNLEPRQIRDIEAQLDAGKLRLLFVAPERLFGSGFLARLVRADPAAFAIDEAHCISQWGHDFRPEYRRLAELRRTFPAASFHAFTATATRQVQNDILQQLKLTDPAVLIGPFDRPNLTYRIVPRQRTDQQCAQAIRRHASGESAGATIIYCLSRRNTEDLAAALRARGIAAEPYHAGLSAADRRRIQDDFANERLDVVVATIAFGMGIDRSNVRCVIHATLPKSVEHYQQETGRAGRDGLPAECILLYSPGDAIRWRTLLQESALESGQDEALRIQLQLLERMQRFASSTTCRHKALADYFGQPYPNPSSPESPETGVPRVEGPQDQRTGAEPHNCRACDVCLSELSTAPDATTIARKILSCVYRVEQRFGPAHVADVLRGRSTQKILDWQHDRLSTFGLLRDQPRHVILSYIDQLVSQGLLRLAGDPYTVLHLTPASLPVLKGEQSVSLLQPAARSAQHARSEPATTPESGALTPEESRLFDSLRALRLKLARARGIPPYLIFPDTVLRELARQQPRTLDDLARIKGVGRRKLAEFGPVFLEHIADPPPPIPFRAPPRE